MPLLSFEGVEVNVPTALQGVQFTFVNGALAIECTNFTGAIVLTKPSTAREPITATATATAKAKAGLAMALSDFPSDVATASTTQLIVQTTTTPTPSVLSSVPTAGSKKRSSPDTELDVDSDLAMDSDDTDAERESDLLHKRLRPNFLSDVEQTMLLAQLETSQQSLRETSVELMEAAQATAIVTTVEATSPEKSSSVASSSPSDFKTPAKAKKATAVSHMKSFFSPDAKELATKKTDATSAGTKRGASATARPSSAKTKGGDATTQISIRDMMFGSAPASKASVVVQAPTPAPATATWSVVETTGVAPVERWGHTVTAIADNRVVVYGGADDDETTLGDLHVFDLATRAWSKPLNCESIPRTWHDAVHLASKHLLLVFGGERAMGGDQLDVLSDIMVLDTECFLWYPPAVSGTPPTARSGHACTVVGNDVVVFGGSRGRSRQSSVHVLDSDAWHWKSVKIEGKPPSARTYHSAVAVGGDSVVYFGGNDAKKSFDSVHVLKKSGTKRDVWTWFHPCVVGQAPRARTGHSATLVDETKILVFGGWDPQSSDDTSAATHVFDDAFWLDTVSWEWERVPVEPTAAGMPLAGRVGHTAVLDVDGKTVLLLGGQDPKEQRLNAVHALQLGTSAPSTASPSTNSSTPENSDSSVPATQVST